MRRRGGWAGMMRFVLIFLTVFFFQCGGERCFCRDAGKCNGWGV